MEGGGGRTKDEQTSLDRRICTSHLIHHHAPTLSIPKHDLIPHIGGHKRPPLRSQHGMRVKKQEPEYLIGRHAQAEGATHRIPTEVEEYHVRQSPVRLHVAE